MQPPTVTYPVYDPAAVVYIPTNTVKPRYDRFPKKESTNVGTLQITFGVICLICNAISLGVTAGFSYGSVGHGFWSGILFIITGSFGYSAGKTKRECHVVSFLVLCILSAACSAVLLLLGIFGALFASPYAMNCNNYYWPECSQVYATETAVESLMALAGLIEAILGIYGAVLCCKAGACGCCKPVTGPVPSYIYSNNGMAPPAYDIQGVQYSYPGNSTYDNQGVQYPYPENAPPPYDQQVNYATPYPPTYATSFEQYQTVQDPKPTVGFTSDSAAVHDEHQQ